MERRTWLAPVVRHGHLRQPHESPPSPSPPPAGGGLAASVFHCLSHCDRLDADARDAQEEVDDLLLVVGEAVGVELLGNRRITRFLFFVLIENPFERGTVA